MNNTPVSSSPQNQKPMPIPGQVMIAIFLCAGVFLVAAGVRDWSHEGIMAVGAGFAVVAVPAFILLARANQRKKEMAQVSDPTANQQQHTSGLRPEPSMTEHRKAKREGDSENALKGATPVKLSTAADLIRGLENADEEVRIQAAKSLGEMGGPEAVQALLRALEGQLEVYGGGASSFKVGCIEALARLRAAEAREAFGMALTDGDEAVRGAAAIAIVKLGEDAVKMEVDRIVRLLGFATQGARRGLTVQLGYFSLHSELALETLRGLVADEDKEVGRRASLILATVRAERAADQAVKAASDQTILRLECARCKQQYRIGEDSVAVSMEYGLGLAAGAVVFSSGPPDREDLIAKLSGDSPTSTEMALERARPSWDLIKASLARGEKRTWRCKACDSVNSYTPEKELVPQTSNPAPASLTPTLSKPASQFAPTSKSILANSQSESIHEEAEKGELEKVQALLKDNPELVMSIDGNGATPLHWAALRGHTDIAGVLLANGADVNARMKGGSTPLHMAAKGGRKKMTELLLAHKAEANVKNDVGVTPLGQVKMIMRLTGMGASLGLGLAEIAQEQGSHHEEVAELLRHHGGHE